MADNIVIASNTLFKYIELNAKRESTLSLSNIRSLLVSNFETEPKQVEPILYYMRIFIFSHEPIGSKNY
jgi:hypothetical protein